MTACMRTCTSALTAAISRPLVQAARGSARLLNTATPGMRMSLGSPPAPATSRSKVVPKMSDCASTTGQMQTGLKVATGGVVALQAQVQGLACARSQHAHDFGMLHEASVAQHDYGNTMMACSMRPQWRNTIMATRSWHAPRGLSGATLRCKADERENVK